MVQIFHNPRCKKSREGLEYLKSKNIDFEIVEYLKTGLDTDTLCAVAAKTGLKPHDLIRTQESVYKSDYKGKSFDDDQWLRIICENPKLLQRPIVVGETKAILAQPPEKMDSVL